MGLESRLHLPFRKSAIVFNYSCTYDLLVFFLNYVSSCKFYRDCILAPIKCQKEKKPSGYTVELSLSLREMSFL